MLKRCDLVYGKSGSGKTTWWMGLADYMWKTKGLKTRCYSGDGGMETLYESGMVDEGIVEIFHYDERDHPSATCTQICKGHWPADMAKVNGPLLLPAPAVLDIYGLFVYEGLTFMSSYIMGDKLNGLGDMAAKGVKLAQEAAIRYEQDGIKYGTNPPSHYGQAQRLMLTNIAASRALPGWTIWTAHEREVVDKETSETLVGPEVAGSALTSKIGGAFGNTTHLDTATVMTKMRDPITGKEIMQPDQEWRAYTRVHVDPDDKSKKKFFANSRAKGMPLYLTPPDAVAFYTKLRECATHARPVAA